MDKFLDNLKRQVEENPVVAMGVAAALLSATSKFVNSAAWRKEVNRRAKKDAKKK